MARHLIWQSVRRLRFTSIINPMYGDGLLNAIFAILAAGAGASFAPSPSRLNFSLRFFRLMI